MNDYMKTLELISIVFRSTCIIKTNIVLIKKKKFTFLSQWKKFFLKVILIEINSTVEKCLPCSSVAHPLNHWCS